MGLRYSLGFTVAFSKILYFCSHKKCHSLPGISEKENITEKFRKSEFDKYGTSGVSAFSITFIYLWMWQFIMDQNSHNSC